uniref:Uncharacterized protein n=1 Tax=Arundo donax TaxID=35708 RepID=A0A0A8ZK46_ARUDO
MFFPVSVIFLLNPRIPYIKGRREYHSMFRLHSCTGIAEFTLLIHRGLFLLISI